MVQSFRVRGFQNGILKASLASCFFLYMHSAVFAQSRNVEDAIRVIVLFCAAGGTKFELTATTPSGNELELKKEGSPANITIAKSEAMGLVDGIRREMDKITASQASEARQCMQPYIQRILDTLLPKGPAGVAEPVAVSPTESKWNHNGSSMSVNLSGNFLKIFYDRPRQGMIDEGVRSGTLLFQGKTAASKIYGTAYVFDRRCNSGIPYQVAGDVMNGGTKIVLSGQAPAQLNGCQPIAYRSDTLVFDR